jgi:hypothetical protein
MHPKPRFHIPDVLSAIRKLGDLRRITEWRFSAANSRKRQGNTLFPQPASEAGTLLVLRAYSRRELKYVLLVTFAPRGVWVGV